MLGYSVVGLGGCRADEPLQRVAIIALKHRRQLASARACHMSYSPVQEFQAKKSSLLAEMICVAGRVVVGAISANP